ncbi:MAG TPA: rhodanese-like domain-containing protein [Candidatus Binataceae bacterium]|nr:rhodanese-like domain-containing protein [Candidatus Binataceae bacterium]
MSLGAGEIPQARPVSKVVRDFSAVVVLALVALGAGLALNHFSSQQMPLVYQTPEQRLDAQLNSLISTPPFKVTPAATVGLPEFRAAVEAKNALILDARPSFFFQQGHVPGALNLARDNFAADYRALEPTLKTQLDRPVFVYCSGGACHDSKLVANALLSLGFANVSVYTGGWDEWSAQGLPVATGRAS